MAGDRNEVLVDYTREFNFVITVRDNNDQIGGYGMDTITFNTTADAGPFEVTFPNDGETLRIIRSSKHLPRMMARPGFSCRMKRYPT